MEEVVTQTMEKIRLVPPGAGEKLDVLGSTMTVKSDGQGGPFLAENLLPPDHEVPLHRHEEDDEIFYILDGVLTVTGADGEYRAGPGSTVCLPRGSRHGFRNDMDSAVRILTICGPGVAAANMFRQFDRERKASGSLQPSRIVAIAGSHGVQMG